MLEAMRSITLLDLQEELGIPMTEAVGLNELRQRHAVRLNELLVESVEKIERVYIISPTKEAGMVSLTVADIKEPSRLPFNKPSGSQSPAIGPVIKRTFADKKPGPTVKIQESTYKSFEQLSQTKEPWSAYFAEIIQILSANKLLFNGRTITVGPDQQFTSVMAAAVGVIPEKETVFVTVADYQNRWPGDRTEYWQYLTQALANEKYLTKETPIKEKGECPLCGQKEVSLYPNGLKGAGLNLFNVDREGAFPSLKKADSWKCYALCLDCADTLYIFKNHLMKNFTTRIAGARALVMPGLLGTREAQAEFMLMFKKYIKNVSQDNISSHEKDLLYFLKDQPDTNLVLELIWATFGQCVDDVTGIVMEVLPSRLNSLSKLNGSMNRWAHPLAPVYPLETIDFDLSLNFLQPLFERPGGKRVEKLNSSTRLFEIKRLLVSAIYREELLSSEILKVFWHEILETARCYLDEANQKGVWRGLFEERLSDKPIKFLTLAGWIRHLARFLAYLSKVEVYLMEETQILAPEMVALRPYFSAGGGINTLEKAFAFLLGVLYGKLVQVQAARGVNVGANALTWLKRLNLTGNDLPELYVKIREKLLSYETEGNPDIQAILKEIAYLGIKLGDKIQLDNISTCYFLLLGQSLTTTILPTKDKK